MHEIELGAKIAGNTDGISGNLQLVLARDRDSAVAS